MKATSSRQDVIAGAVVALIALPLSLGIASASGFPPVAGLITAITGGLLVSFIGHADATIKGPAAGLIVIVLGAVTELGGDLDGVRRTLAVGVVAAVLQIGFGALGAGRLVALVPPAVIRGMLAAIGVILICKQLPLMLGTGTPGGEPLEVVAHLPHWLTQANPLIALVGLLSLAAMLWAPRTGPLGRIPAPVWAVVVSIPLALALGLSGSQLLTLPSSLATAFMTPDFSMITHWVSVKYIVALALVGSVESAISVRAVDAMRPHAAPAALDRDLVATGIGNLVCASIGGLPMISEIVRSRANLDAGGRTRLANASHGLFLLAAVVVFGGLLQQIPMAALAAMLVATGARLAHPKTLEPVFNAGWRAALVCVATLSLTVGIDLLVGVVGGIAVHVALQLLPSTGKPDWGTRARA